MGYSYGGDASKRQKRLNKALTGKATDKGERQNRPPQNTNSTGSTQRQSQRSQKKPKGGAKKKKG